MKFPVEELTQDICNEQRESQNDALGSNSIWGHMREENSMRKDNEKHKIRIVSGL